MTNAELVALWVVRAVAGYVAAGLLFAIPFLWRGVGRIDPVAEKGTLGLRLLILPGVTAFWPVLLLRWISGVRAPPVECNAHRRRAERSGP